MLLFNMFNMFLANVAIILLLVSEFNASDDSEEDDKILDDVFIDNMRRKCLKNGNSTILEDYEEASKKFEACISTSKLPTTEQELLQRICTEYPKCLNDFMEKIDHCLGVEERFLTDLLLTSFKEHCKKDGELFRAKIEGISNTTCYTPLAFIGYAISIRCHPKLKFMHHKDPEFIIKKSETCSDLRIFQACVIDLIPKMCGNDESTKYASLFLEPALEWCEKHLSINEVD